MKTLNFFAWWWITASFVVLTGLVLMSRIPARAIEIEGATPEYTLEAKVTAYSSSVDETDNTPFLTAANTRTRYGIVANNCLPFGAKVKIGDEMFVVEDRMNRRFGCEIFDVWHESRELAKSFGIKHLEVEVYN